MGRLNPSQSAKSGRPGVSKESRPGQAGDRGPPEETRTHPFMDYKIFAGNKSDKYRRRKMCDHQLRAMSGMARLVFFLFLGLLT
jgi:hypothetical protein